MKRRKGQSILEYTLVIVVISAALMAMQTYLNRASNARLKQVQLELNESIR